MSEWKQEAVEFFSRIWMYILYVIIGLIAHVSRLLLLDKKRSFWNILGSTGLALLAGYLSSVYCYNNCPQKAGYIVPLATLMSDKLFAWLFTLDYKALMNKLLNLNTTDGTDQGLD